MLFSTHYRSQLASVIGVALITTQFVLPSAQANATDDLLKRIGRGGQVIRDDQRDPNIRRPGTGNDRGNNDRDHRGGNNGGRKKYVTREDCMKAVDGASMGKRMGQRNAQRIVNAVFDRLGRSCSQVDRVGQIIAETPLAQPSQGGLFAACFYLGYIDTMWDEVEQIYDRCGNRCFDSGAEVGRISAEGYCYASIAVGGLLDPGFISQPSLPFCGQNLVLGCKSEYVWVATQEINGCHAYTVGDFSETFDNSVRQDCFVPSDIPIRDRLF